MNQTCSGVGHGQGVYFGWERVAIAMEISAPGAGRGNEGWTVLNHLNADASDGLFFAGEGFVLPQGFKTRGAYVCFWMRRFMNCGMI